MADRVVKVWERLRNRAVFNAWSEVHSAVRAAETLLRDAFKDKISTSLIFSAS